MRPTAPMRVLVILALSAALLDGTTAAQSSELPIYSHPVAADPDHLKWVEIPGTAGVRVAWAIGSEKPKAPYALRVRIAPGARIPIHKHPDTRVVTVLSGTVHFAYGNGVDAKSRSAFRAGTTYVVTAGINHTVWAESDTADYQEIGFGPTGTEFVKP